ncbi:MAG: DUF3352 domain-containing protein [Bacteroidota bacterium]
MRKFFLFLIPISIISISLYVIYSERFPSKNRDLFSYVPGSAAIVFENDQVLKFWNELQAKSIWKGLLNVPEFQSFKESFEALIVSENEYSASILKLLSNNRILVSLHVTEKNKFDGLFIVPISKVGSSDVYAYFKKLAEEKKIDFRPYTFQDRELYSLTDKNDDLFTFTVIDDVLVFSFTPFLVEDVIRLSEGMILGFKELNPSNSGIVNIENDEGNLCVNYKQLGFLLSTFSSPEFSSYIKELGQVATSGFLDLKIDSERLLITGFSFSKRVSEFLSIFENQQASPIRIHQFVPNRTGIFFHFSISDQTLFSKKFEDYRKQNSNLQSSASRLKKEYDYDPSSAFDWIGNEFGLCVFETITNELIPRLAVVEITDVGEALNQLNNLSEKSSLSSGDSIYLEKYGDIELRKLSIGEFPTAVFGNLFQGFEECFYSIYENNLLIANNLNILKTALTDINEDNTWGKTVQTNSFIDNLGQDANYSILINTKRAWRSLVSSMSPKYRKVFEQNPFVFQGFELIAVQNSYFDNKFYSSLYTKYDGRLLENGESSYELITETVLDTSLVRKPYVLRNHQNRNFISIASDQVGQISAIDKQGEILWEDSLGQALVSDVFTIDYYKNGKLQYLFATEDAIHIKDLNGKNVDYFPVELNRFGKIALLSLVDYDNSKNYRFFIGTEEGNLLLTNKKAQLLEGWNPKKLTGKLALEPTHIRVLGKDYLLVIQENGFVNVFNRRGEGISGFPIDLKVNPSDKILVDYGSGSGSTIIHLVGQEGEMIQFNLKGDILIRKQLYKPITESTFSFIPDALGKTYIIGRKDLGRVSFIDRAGNTLFEKDYLDIGEMTFQYYVFESTKQVVVVNDGVQDYSYIYDSRGGLLNLRPLSSSGQIAMVQYSSDDFFHLYHLEGNSLKVSKFQW